MVGDFVTLGKSYGPSSRWISLNTSLIDGPSNTPAIALTQASRIPIPESAIPIMAIVFCEGSFIPKYPRTIPMIPSGTPQIGKNHAHRLITPITSEAIAMIRSFPLPEDGSSLGWTGAFISSFMRSSKIRFLSLYMK